MRTLSIFIPRGSRGILMLKLLIDPRSEDGTPLLPTSLALNSWPLIRLIRHVAEPEATSRSRVAFTSSELAADRVSPEEPTSAPSGPICEFSVLASEENVTSTEPCTWLTVPLVNPLPRWMPFMTALTWEMLTGPSGMFWELMLTCLRLWLMTWVRNGKPAIETDGFL